MQLANDEMAYPGFSYTSEGWIPHKEHRGLGISMPVKIDNKHDANPVRHDGKLVYALPNGGEYCG